MEIYRSLDGSELAIRAATWELNPRITFNSLSGELRANPTKFWRNYGSRVGGGGVDLAVKDPQEVLTHINLRHLDPWNYAQNKFFEHFRGRPDRRYFMHFDLAKNKDSAGMGLVHREPTGVVVVDFMFGHWASPGKNIQFSDLRQYLYDLHARGFNIVRVTYDQWNCLAEGTLIHTDRGFIPIETVEPGCVVQSRKGPREVVKRFGFGVRPTLRVDTSEGDLLEGTGKHRIEVARRGDDPIVWEWCRLDALRVGDTVRMAGVLVAGSLRPQLDHTARAVIRSITPSRASVHDLEVEGDHSYVANGFISHNSEETRQILEGQGFATGASSADKTMAPYDTLIEQMLTDRLDYYNYPQFIREMQQLRTNGIKYDHPKLGGKDVSDAVACATFEAINDAIENPVLAPGILVVHRQSQTRGMRERYERSVW